MAPPYLTRMSLMLCWLSLALVLATARAMVLHPSLESKEPNDVLHQCQGHAWVRAPDLTPGDVIAGDVKVKLLGPCAEAESYTIGLRYKERIFWKLRRQDAPLPKRPDIKYNFNMNPDVDLFDVRLPFQNTGLDRMDYNETDWMAYKMSVQNKDLWSVHEEERIAFEIKTELAIAEGADPLPRNFTSRFGILVPNTNYPPGLDYRYGPWMTMRETDTIRSESIYEYFVQIKFINGTTSEIPAGITTFTPFYLPTEEGVPHVNLSMAPPNSGSNLELDTLQSNYTIEIPLLDRAHVYQNSSMNFTVTVHRTGYTNRTDTPTELCVSLSELDVIEWYPAELKDRTQPSDPYAYTIKALVPSKQIAYNRRPSPCRQINFAAAAEDLTQDGHVSSTSSEPLSLSLHVDRDAVPDFSTYYHKLVHRVSLTLRVKPDPSEPWVNAFEKEAWEKQITEVDETDYDWVPWSFTQTRSRFLTGKFGVSVIPMQNQGLARSMPIHYLSDEARQPSFVHVSDIDDLRSMSPEERDLIAPLAQPSMKVFAEGEELSCRYFTVRGGRQPIYVGDTWTNKVLPMVAERHGTDNIDHLLVVQ